MSRKAILIEASNVRGEVDLPGARADIVNMVEFLQSETGGAWDENEIAVLRKPKSADVKAKLTLAQKLDYTLIYFSGHGQHYRGTKTDETSVCVSEGEEMSVSELDPKNDRCLTVIDTCRKIVPLLEARADKYSLKFAHAMDLRRMKARALFDSSVTKAEIGRIIMYSCNLDESAGDEKYGGLFTYSLLDFARRWSDKQLGNSVLDTNDAFVNAATETTRENSRQHPQYSCGRRRWHFPFAVHVL